MDGRKRQNYLERIEREGSLRGLEPAIVKKEFSYAFFVTRDLTMRQSIIQPNKYLTPKIGFVHLSCKNDSTIGHTIIYTESLNYFGQLQLRKLELRSKRSWVKICKFKSPSIGEIQTDKEKNNEILRLFNSVNANELDLKSWQVENPYQNKSEWVPISSKKRVLFSILYISSQSGSI